MVKVRTLAQLEKEWESLQTEIQGRAAFKVNTPEAKEERRETGRTDKLFFAKTYFPEYFDKEWAPFHSEWPAISQIKNEPILVAALRGAGKSTFFNFLDTVHAICYGSSKFTVLSGYSESASELFSGRILIELMYNHRLESDFGKFFESERRPSMSFFIAKSGVYGTQTVVKALSIGQSCRGLVWGASRPDRAVLDDIQTSKRARSQTFIKETLNWIFTDFIPALTADYTMIILATFLHSKCVASILRTGGKVLDAEYNPVQTKLYPALANNKPTWPSMFPIKRLTKLKQTMGSKSFDQEYLLIPKSFDGDVFQEDWFKYYERSKHPLSDYDCVVTWIDPATKSGDNACKKAVITVGQIGRCIHVLSAWIRKSSVSKMIDAVFDQGLTYHSYRVYYEDNGGQALLAEIFEAEFEKRRLSLPIKAHTENENKIQRIEETLSADIENGYILFDKTEGDQEELLEQLKQFPNGIKDGPDALAGGVKYLKKIMGTRITAKSVRTGQRRATADWKDRY